MALFHDLTALEAAAAVRSREVSPVELVEHALDRIARLDDRLGAFVTLTADAARRQAKEAERTVLAADDPGSLPPLLGVPTAIKDLNLTKGVRTKLGSASYADFVSPIDDYIVRIAPRGRHDQPGQDGDAGVWFAVLHRDRHRSADSLALGPVPDGRGIEWWRGGRGRGRLASDCPRQRWRRVHSHTSERVRPRRFEAVARTRLSRAPRLRIGAPRCFRRPYPNSPRRRGVLGRSRHSAAGRSGPPARPPAGRDLPRVVRSRAGAYAHRAIHRVGNSVRSGSSSPQRVGTGQRTPRESRPRSDGHPSALSVGRRSVLRDGVVGIGKHRARRSGARELASAADPLLAWPGGGRDRNRVRAGDRHAGSVYSRQGLAATADFDAVLTPTLAMLPQPVGWFDADGDPAADFERQKRFTPFTAIYNMTGQPAISVPLFESADGQPIGVMLAGRPAAEATLLCLAAQLEAARPWRDRRPGIWDD